MPRFSAFESGAVLRRLLPLDDGQPLVRISPDAGLTETAEGSGADPQSHLVLLPQSEAMEAEPLTGQ
jgi:hypothetical protein